MTTVAVLADPPHEGTLPNLAATSPLSAPEVATLYEAMCRDVVTAAAGSGGDLLVNYRPDDQLPDGAPPSEATLRELVADALGDTEDVRFEVQVGETLSGRAGNTVTHLLEQEAVGSVGVVRPEAAFLTRPAIDSAAMKLRSSEVVLAPSPGGRVHYAAFAEPVDFADAFAAPALRTLTDRALAADHAVDFVPSQPLVETGADLADATALLRARRAAGRNVPTETARCLDELGVDVAPAGDGGLDLVRDR